MDVQGVTVREACSVGPVLLGSSKRAPSVPLLDQGPHVKQPKGPVYSHTVPHLA
jgi:hypothetical protein